MLLPEDTEFIATAEDIFGGTKLFVTYIRAETEINKQKTLQLVKLIYNVV